MIGQLVNFKIVVAHSVMPKSLQPHGLSFTVSWRLLKLMSIESVMPSNHLILCCPLLLLPSIFPSSTVFANELVLPIRWPKYIMCTDIQSTSCEMLGWMKLKLESRLPREIPIPSDMQMTQPLWQKVKRNQKAS